MPSVLSPDGNVGQAGTACLLSCALLLVTCLMPLPVAAQARSAAEIAAEVEAKVRVLRGRSDAIMQESREIAGVAPPEHAKGIVRVRIDGARSMVDRLEQALAQSRLTRDEVAALRKAAAEGAHKPGQGAGETVARTAAKQIGKQLVGQAAKRLLGVAGVITDLGEEAAYAAIGRMSARELADMVTGEEARTRLFSELYAAAIDDLNGHHADMDRLDALARESARIREEINRERLRARAAAESEAGNERATRHSVRERDTDPDADERERAMQAGERVIDWYTSAQNVNRHAVFVCPPNPKRAYSTVYLYGTTRYAIVAPICVAAAHAGVISAQAGGRVRLQVFPAERRGVVVNFSGSKRNGITSHTWGSSATQESFIPRQAAGAGVSRPAGTAR